MTNYCKVPPRGRSCSINKAFVPTGQKQGGNDDVGGPHVFVAGSFVVVLTRRCCADYPPAKPASAANIIYVSGDGGQNFGGQQVVGTADVGGDAIVGPGPRISTISDGVTGGTYYQAMMAGSFTEKSAHLGSGPSQWYGGTLALVDENTPLAAFFDIVGGGSTTYFRRYSGNGDLNDASSWTPTASLGAGDDPRLAYGARGVFLLYRVGAAGQRRYVLRNYDGATFGPPTGISEQGDPLESDFFQDASGRLHAIWSATKTRNLTYRTSAGGAAWSGAGRLVAGGGHLTFYNAEVGAGPNGRGWAVWDSNSDHGRVAAAPLEPDPASFGEKSKSTTVGGTVIRFRSPKECVPGNSALRVRVTSRTKKKLARRRGRSKIRRVTFYVDRKRKATDRKAPFRANISAQGLAAGRHRLQAKVALRQIETGRKFSKTLRISLNVC